MKNEFIDTNEHIQLLAEIELKGRIAAGTVDYDPAEDTYAYDAREIIEAVVEVIASAVDYNDPKYSLITNILEDRVRSEIDTDALDEVCAEMARLIREDEEERRLLMQDYFRMAGVAV